MCGLFGFSGPGRGDPELLAQLARQAAQRGPDAWGLWADGRRHASLGRLPAATVAGMPAPQVMLGHCRLATVLGTKRVDCCQPIVAAGWAVTHNGSVRNAGDLARRHRFAWATGVDSEAIAHLLGLHGDLGRAMAEVDHGGHFAVAALNMATGAVSLAAQGLPLWRLTRDEGAYWCSLPHAGPWEALHA
jgi:asparagine synthetase B (glutamine-hydrolysing)